MNIFPSDALIVIDVQNDFCAGGALAVEDGDAVVPIINKLIPCFEHVVFTRDWHPPNHNSFSDNPQYVDKSWPPHCIANSEGAAFHPDLKVPSNAPIFSTGQTPEEEGYSGFEGTDLHHALREKNVDRVFLCGLATDYCVKHTALAAADLKYHVMLIVDAVRGVSPQTTHDAFHEMRNAGVETCSAGEIA